MLGTPNVYYIWYGNWAAGPVTSIVEDLARHLGGSSYFNINTTYYSQAKGKNSPKMFVSGLLNFGGSTIDNYSRGAVLGDADVQAIVSRAISSGAFLGPGDTNGVYVVLSSADVNETSGLDTQYCGFHTHGTIGGADIKYAFVGDPTRSPSACEQQTTGPNGSSGADGMASIIAHETEEAITDPDLNAWYDQRGQENADKCAWTFGATYTTLNGAMANMQLGQFDYLIQQNWVNANGGFCAKSYP
jgi:hypothetical protein